MAAKISVIIPQFGQSELTVRCVESLLQFHRETSPLEILIVDDGSPQIDLQNIQSHHLRRTTLIRSSRNCGVTAAWNLGIKQATGDRLIFLNNDVETHGEWCEQLASAVEHHQGVIAGPERRIERHLPERMSPLFPHKQLLTGWCFAVSRKLLHELGGFDARFRLYFSDSDLQLQIVQRNGDSNALREVRGLPLSHARHQTTRHLTDRSQQWIVDRDRFLQKWSA